MNKIVLLGTGKSSRHLLRFLYENIDFWNAEFVVCDLNLEEIKSRYAAKSNFILQEVNANDLASIESIIQGATITISMFPAFMHPEIAKICLKCKSHLITPSFLSEEMKSMHQDVLNADLIFLNELGFDPGIDHLVTLDTFKKWEEKGAQLISYKSYAGGLVADSSDNNPWNYKFSWNPRNVVLAAQGGTSKFLENGSVKYIPPYSVFERAETIVLPNGFSFDAYANRDSVQYKSLYQWNDVQTLFRGTLRRLNFCKGWDLIIKLGLVDDSFQMDLNENESLFSFYSRFYPFQTTETAKDDFIRFLGNEANADLIKKIEFLGFFDQDTKVPVSKGSPAFIFQKILEEKWALEESDTDFVVMAHFFEFLIENKKVRLISYFTKEGQDNYFTAMSELVGMPIAFATQLIIEGQMKQRGVLLPFTKEIYQPILTKLEEQGIHFIEEEIVL